MSISVHCSFRLSDLDKGIKAPHSVYFWIVFFIIAYGTAASATLFSAVPNCVTQCTPTLCSLIFIFGQVGGYVCLESRPLVSSKRRHLFPQSSYSCFFCLYRLTAFHCGFWFYLCTLGDMKGVLSIKHMKKKHNVLDLYRYLIMRRPKRSQKPSFSRTSRTGGGGGGGDLRLWPELSWGPAVALLTTTHHSFPSVLPTDMTYWCLNGCV